MLYGWIEVGVSNDTLFANETAQDIIVRTIYDNKVILGNTNGTRANAAVYVWGNNVGIRKVPQGNVALDVDGLAVLRSAQVGLSNTPTSLIVNGDVIIKDKTKNFATAMELSVVNNFNLTTVSYNNVPRIKISDGQGIEINDTLNVVQDVFATSFQVTSDERFKTDIRSTIVQEDTETIKGLAVKDYEMKADPDKTVKGFIAQEVEKVFPQAIVPKRGFTEEGVLLNDIKTIDMNQILALNTSVLQDVLSRLEAVEKFVFKNNK